MKATDRLGARLRIRQAAPWIDPGAWVLDIGCDDGSLFRQLGSRLGRGVGIDPRLEAPVHGPNWTMHPGWFPQDLPDPGPYDCVTLLAVLEHIPTAAQRALATTIVEHLKPGGRVVVTVPSPAVDRILPVLQRLRLADAATLDEHYGFQPAETRGIFEAVGLSLLRHRTFELGLNNLFVFERSA